MHWVVFPQDPVNYLLFDDRLRTLLSEHLPSDFGTEFILKDDPPQYAGRMIPLKDEAQLLLLWKAGNGNPVRLRDSALLSVWSQEGESTVWTIGEEYRSEVLERLCQLAQRSWNRQEFPAHWDYKKVEQYPTIYAGDWRVRNLRVAYSVRDVGGRSVVDIGTLFYARRNQKSIKIPTIQSQLLEEIPSTVDPPAALAELAPKRQEAAESAQHSNPPVLILSKPEGENRHLFSLTYGDWAAESGPLTRQQRRVIVHKVQRPLRVHGPAGSGKTLVLILKAQHLLRHAQDQNQQCHVLLIVNRNPLRQTIRTAIEVMDDRAFLATSREDLQYLDVSTLHGWCIRELGLEHGPQYVYDQDPEASKSAQARILAEVVEDLLPDALKGMRSSLSSDLIARLEGDRQQLLQDLRYEIAIRIKGKGFKTNDRDAYLKSPTKSFVGASEKERDRHFLFHIFTKYQERFDREGLLDTDDVVLSMAARLGAPLWSVQRRKLGYDYVLVDEAHLFNDNEKRVLPHLTRGTTSSHPLVMTFDEAQSIGGQRTVGLADVGIRDSEKQILSSVHRSSPDILALARDLVESSSLAISEFHAGESVATMTPRELERCRKPSLMLADGDQGVAQQTAVLCNSLRSRNLPRIGVIVFDPTLIPSLLSQFSGLGLDFREVKERGEVFTAMPKPGVFVMTPETCGGLEFDGAILIGVDDGRVPRSIPGLSAEGYLSLQEEAYLELYTAVTRARYRLIFLCDSRRGPSSILRPLLNDGLVELEGGL